MSVESEPNDHSFRQSDSMLMDGFLALAKIITEYHRKKTVSNLESTVSKVGDTFYIEEEIIKSESKDLGLNE